MMGDAEGRGGKMMGEHGGEGEIEESRDTTRVIDAETNIIL